MADLPTAASVTRTELALAALNLHDGTYKVIRNGFAPGHVAWRRDTAESPFVAGRVLLGAVRDIITSTLTIRVKGTSAADCQAKMSVLCRAFEQFSYTLTVTLDGVPWDYVCEPADYAVGSGELDSVMLSSKHQEVTFEFPRDPVLTSAPF